jgi:class 3 adenylate cyclase
LKKKNLKAKKKKNTDGNKPSNTGDAYLAVGGLPLPLENHAEAVANMALDVMEQVKLFNIANKHTLGGQEWNIRIGIHVST